MSNAQSHFKALRYKPNYPILGKRYIHFIRIGENQELAESARPELLGNTVEMDDLKELYKDVEVNWEDIELIDIVLVIPQDRVV